MLVTKKSVWHNVYTALGLYLGLSMLFYTLTRILFFVFNRGMFESTSHLDFLYLLLAGTRFDLSAVLYTNLLFIVLLLLPLPFRFHSRYQRTLKYVFLSANSITLATNVADIIYYRFTLRRTTWTVMQEFANENLGVLGWNFFVDFWYMLILWLGLVVMMAWLYRKIKLSAPQNYNPWIYYPAHTAAMVLVLTLCLGGMRGGFATHERPITLSNAKEYIQRPGEINLVLNTPFSMIRTLGKKGFEKVQYYSEQELDAIYSPIHVPNDTAAFQPKNVVIIILESFSKEAIGGYNAHQIGKDGYQSFTPFLDSLMQESKVYWHSFANGKKSIDAMPSLLTSIPSIQEPLVLSLYATNNLPSLPKMLEEKGYRTSFFHGGTNGSMGFEPFTKLLGIDEYYGRTEYGNDDDFDGNWGIWDEEFMQYTADKLNTFQEPFMSTMFTLSSHHPFKLPARYEGKFKEGPLPLYACINYTDMALQKFFAKASTMPWYKNTLFVITADHTAEAKHYPEYQSDWGSFSVPILFFAPGDPAFRGVEQRVVQQLDVMPTVLSYLHYDKPYFSFGKNMLAPASGQDFAVNYNGVFQWIEGEYLIQFDEEKTLAMYNYVADPLLKNDLKDQLSDKRQQMETRLKAFIQQYKNRMVDDKLQAEEISILASK